MDVPFFRSGLEPRPESMPAAPRRPGDAGSFTRPAEPGRSDWAGSARPARDGFLALFGGTPGSGDAVRAGSGASALWPDAVGSSSTRTVPWPAPMDRALALSRMATDMSGGGDPPEDQGPAGNGGPLGPVPVPEAVRPPSANPDPPDDPDGDVVEATATGLPGLSAPSETLRETRPIIAAGPEGRGRVPEGIASPLEGAGTRKDADPSGPARLLSGPDDVAPLSRSRGGEPVGAAAGTRVSTEGETRPRQVTRDTPPVAPERSGPAVTRAEPASGKDGRLTPAASDAATAGKDGVLSPRALSAAGEASTDPLPSQRMARPAGETGSETTRNARRTAGGDPLPVTRTAGTEAAGASLGGKEPPATEAAAGRESGARADVGQPDPRNVDKLPKGPGDGRRDGWLPATASDEATPDIRKAFVSTATPGRDGATTAVPATGATAPPPAGPAEGLSSSATVPGGSPLERDAAPSGVATEATFPPAKFRGTFPIPGRGEDTDKAADRTGSADPRLGPEGAVRSPPPGIAPPSAFGTVPPGIAVTRAALPTGKPDTVTMMKFDKVAEGVLPANAPQPASSLSAPTAAPGHPPPSAGLAQTVAQQVVAALPKPLSDLGSGAVEISLDPPELGRVRLTLLEVAGVMTLAITAERPETADIMRRHLDLLAQEFGREGLGAPQVRIGGEGEHRQGAREDSRPDDTVTAVPATEPAGTDGSRRGTQRALDLRL